MKRALEKRRPASHRLRLYRRRTPGGIFLITKTLVPRRPALEPTSRQTIVDCFEHQVFLGRVEIGAFVVMPDHFHLLCGLLGDLVVDYWVGRLMSAIGRFTTPALRLRGCRWRDGFHDREVRNQKEFHDKIDYIHLNPVRAGMVENPEDWPWSSARGLPWVTLAWH